MTTVFISYRRDDSGPFAGRLADALSDEFGKQQVFRDIDGIPGGSDFEHKIRESIAASDVVLAVIGRRWVTLTDDKGRRRLDDPEDFVVLELASALKAGKHVIPVLVDGARMPRRDKVPEPMHGMLRINAVEISDSRFEYDVARLVAAVRGGDGAWQRLVLVLRRAWPQLLAAVGALAGASALAFVVYVREPLPPVVATSPQEMRVLLEHRRGELDQRMAATTPAQADERARIDVDRRRVDELLANLPQSAAERSQRIEAVDKTLAQTPDLATRRAREALRASELAPARARLAALADGIDATQAAEAALLLGELAYGEGDYRAAAPRLKQAARLQPDNAAALNLAGHVEQELGELDSAQKLLERALALRRASTQPGDAMLLESQLNLALLYKQQRRIGDAEALLLEAHEAASQRKPPPEAWLALVKNNLAQLYRAAAPPSAAMRERIDTLLGDALELTQRAHGAHSVEVATALNNQGAFHAANGEPAAASTLTRSALELREKLLPPDHPAIAESLNNLAALHAGDGHPELAEPLYRRALEIQQRAFGAGHRSVAVTLNNLGQTSLRLRRHADAQEQLQRSIAIQTTAGAPDKVALALTRNNLALVLLDSQRAAEAEPLFKDAATTLLAELPPQHAQLQSVIGNYIACLQQQGRHDEAQAWRQRLDAPAS